MNDSTHSDHRRALIELKKADADRLMATATHEVMKEQLRLAVRDLNEGERWLQSENINDSPFIMGIVDLTIQLASWRLMMVERALQSHGPGAATIGQ
jgi:hypothetical protein